MNNDPVRPSRHRTGMTVGGRAHERAVEARRTPAGFPRDDLGPTGTRPGVAKDAG